MMLALILASLFNPCLARADFYPISMPDTDYTRRTTLLPIGSGGSQVSDGRLTVQFHYPQSDYLNSLYLAGGTWVAGWGTPPFVEVNTPQVLSHTSWAYEGVGMLLTFSRPVRTFGLEARPHIGWEASRDQWVRVAFFNGPPGRGNLVGSIERLVYESQGALLFAARTTSTQFTSVQILFQDIGAIARLRYELGDLPTPTNAQMFVSSINDAIPSGQDQVTINVGDTLMFTFQVKFSSTNENVDVTYDPNTTFFTDPPRGAFTGGSNQLFRWRWRATEDTRNRTFPIYARYYHALSGQSITDTVLVHVRP
jgi:hypothetical protein